MSSSSSGFQGHRSSSAFSLAAQGRPRLSTSAARALEYWVLILEVYLASFS